LDYPGGRYLPQPSVFFSLDLFEAVGGVREDLQYTMDLDLWLRMRERTPLHYISEELSITRRHADTKTHGDNRNTLEEAGQVIREHAFSRFDPYVLSVLNRLAFHRAEGLTGRALDHYFDKEYQQAVETLLRSLLRYPPIAFTIPWLATLARLVLPQKIQAKLFTRY